MSLTAMSCKGRHSSGSIKERASAMLQPSGRWRSAVRASTPTSAACVCSAAHTAESTAEGMSPHSRAAGMACWYCSADHPLHCIANSLSGHRAASSGKCSVGPEGCCRSSSPAASHRESRSMHCAKSFRSTGSLGRPSKSQTTYARTGSCERDNKLAACSPCETARRHIEACNGSPLSECNWARLAATASSLSLESSPTALAAQVAEAAEGCGTEGRSPSASVFAITKALSNSERSMQASMRRSAFPVAIQNGAHSSISVVALSVSIYSLHKSAQNF
mmetsp:Transcript_159172/g.510542  ORF Transcript_159172/g.510542 Transcript_159172/m.510542 type:complete len:277 (+) Transcript_159172:604-1434(+)